MIKAIKSYVRRSGRISKRQQKGLGVLKEQYLLPIEDAPWSLEQVFGRVADTVVEIGFGMGKSLLTMAQDNPDINYIGIEVHPPGVGSLVADIEQAGVCNIKIIEHDAVEALGRFEDHSLSGIQIFFPDPWHKKRHHKRRLIQTPFVMLMMQKLKQGGFIHCATDWQEYAEHMLEVLSQQAHLVNQAPEGYCPRPPSRPLTKFEQRGINRGHGVWDLIFKVSNSKG